jgi:hypothetical protein
MLINLTSNNDPTTATTIDLDKLRDIAKATHDPAVIEVLLAVVKSLCQQPEFMARAAQNFADDMAGMLRDLHSFIWLDETPSRARLEVVEQHEGRIGFRYYSGWSKWSAGSRMRFEKVTLSSIPDVQGEGIGAVLRAVQKSVLPGAFSWAETAGERKRKHLIRMLGEALRQREDTRRPLLL